GDVAVSEYTDHAIAFADWQRADIQALHLGGRILKCVVRRDALHVWSHDVLDPHGIAPLGKPVLIDLARCPRSASSDRGMAVSEPPQTPLAPVGLVIARLPRSVCHSDVQIGRRGALFKDGPSSRSELKPNRKGVAIIRTSVVRRSFPDPR